MNRATIAVDRSLEDVGNIVDFGHLNVQVPDQRLALLFYVDGLGLTRDPYERTGVDNAWINIGDSQFHLPTGPAQVVRGVVRLVLPDFDILIERLATVASMLKGTAFCFARGVEGVTVTCPWGNRFEISQPDRNRSGRNFPAIASVEFAVAKAMTKGIARFYEDIVGAKASCGEDDAGSFARIEAGPQGSLIFRESARRQPPYDGHHVQITVADFSGVHQRLMERGLVTEESNRSQYRFRDVVDVESGAKLTTLEHEVRSMRHPM